ncbi:proteasome-type protease [Zavarzinia aquatilis]|uniref:Peptidase n=1 Tax=Zavarzinia aquatilis TaxID=2211142 RepID=A0A317EIA7_9PROT|nr:proteasome-type protease [Zavarzinia aquatilis]PWR25800.1 peptidase [Zavarzinia aquatilis]
MTYAVGLLLDAGIVFASDTRTNAGVDHVSTFKKMTVFEVPGERVIVLMGSGNLAITQSVVSQLHAWNQAVPKTGAARARANRAISRAGSMFEAARIVGAALREVHALDGEYLQAHGTDFNAMFILGGQIGEEKPRLFQIYAAGNFIEAGKDTPYFQIGETKYGKPIIDRIVRPDTSLTVAAKCTLISFDSTMRSNVSVAMPLDVLIYEKGSLKVGHYRRIPRNDPYMTALSDGWSKGILAAFEALPDPDWPVDSPESRPKPRRRKA